ncbi:unnamed protein product, partial [Lampetra fluviatilis]
SVWCAHGRLRPWLLEQIESGLYPGLRWEDDSKATFRIPWKHAAKHDYCQQEDAALFKGWALFKGKFRQGDRADPPAWKTRLRCALNKSSDFEEVSERSQLDISEPYKVYRVLPEGSRGKGGQLAPCHHSCVTLSSLRVPPSHHSCVTLPSLVCHPLIAPCATIPSLVCHPPITRVSPSHRSMCHPLIAPCATLSSLVCHPLITRVSPSHHSVCHPLITRVPPSHHSCATLSSLVECSTPASRTPSAAASPSTRAPRPATTRSPPCCTFLTPAATTVVSALASPQQQQQPSLFYPGRHGELLAAALGSLGRGLTLRVDAALGRLQAERLCRGRVYWSGPCAPTHTGRPNKMERRAAVTLFDRDSFMRELHNFTLGGPEPQTEIVLCFCEEYPGGNLQKKLITAHVELVLARQLLENAKRQRDSGGQQQQQQLLLLEKAPEGCGDEGWPFVSKMKTEVTFTSPHRHCALN